MKGIILGNRYELQEKIGEGGMSEVFKARCNKLNRFVAVKILKKEFCNNADIVEKFKGEATAIATLSDSNIVNILDVGTQDETNYIVMEYVNGKTLKDVIKEVGKMNYETGISTAIQIAKALDCAHKNKIIHRDVKPQNILVTEDGIMKVTDFGIAKSTTSSTITNTSTIMGSAHYLSPEQAKGSFIDCRTDLYSLGVVLYEMVTGSVPFEGDSAVTIALKHIQENPVPPKELNLKIPDSLNKLILKAMEKEPSKRYQTAKDIIADLQKIKDNPNAIIGDKSDDNDHTIIMSAVTEEVAKQHGKPALDNKHIYDEDDEYYDYDDEVPKKPSSKNKLMRRLIIGLISIIVFSGGVFGVYKLVSNKENEVIVPNVMGINKDEAKQKLESLGLIYVEAGTDISEKPENTVIEMNKEAGSKVVKGTQIRVIVSGGENKLKMPDLIEDSLETAEAILNSYDLKISETSEDYSDDIPKGKIMKQIPDKDTDVTSDTQIKVVISKGQRIRKTSVPSLVGLTVDEARQKLTNSGLKFNIESVDIEDKSKDGTVIKQSKDAGEDVVFNTTISIDVGKFVEKKDTNQNQTGSETDKKDDEKTKDSNDKINGNNSDTRPSENVTIIPNIKPTENKSTDENAKPKNNEPEGPWDDAKLQNANPNE